MVGQGSNPCCGSMPIEDDLETAKRIQRFRRKLEREDLLADKNED